MGTNPTITELRDAVRAAIYNTLELGGVQDYEIAGKKISRYSLKELRALDREYTAQIALETRGTGGSYAQFNRETR